MIGLGISIPKIAINSEGGSLASLISSLFRNNEQGVWYDPSDMSTMFQDVAGVTPVTAVEQPVGLILDKSKAGVGTNGAFRYNLLTNTEDFGAASWVKSRATISTNAAIAPNGTLTADSLNQSTNSTLVGEVTCSFVWESGVVYTFSVYAKPSGKNFVRIIENGSVSSGDSATFFNVSTGVVGAKSNLHTASITPAGDGWYRCSISFVSISSSTKAFALGIQCADNDNSTTIVSSGGLYIWGASLTTVANASLPYQRIGADWSSTLPGNHATQTTSAARPVLSARYNLLTNTEAFDNFVWSPTTRIVVTANDAINPNGLQNADKITETSENGTHRVTQNVVFSQNTQYTFSCHWKKGTRRWVWISINNASDNCNQFFDLDSLSLGVSQQVGLSVEKVSASIHDAGSGWVFCRFTARIGTLLSPNAVFTGMAPSDGVNSYVGSASEYGFIWGADLRAANDGVGLPAYQRVNTSTDYDTAGFPMYLRFDGVDDWLVTPSIDFTGTDKMTVFAGVRKLSDGTLFGTLIELGSNIDVATDGSIRIIANGTSNFNVGFSYDSRGTIPVGAKVPFGVFPAPTTLVAAGISQISTDTVILRVNGTQVAAGTTDQGTGNYRNLPLFIGRRNGEVFPFNGHLYSLIVRGAQSTAQQIANAEKYVAIKTGFSKPSIIGLPTIGL